MLICCFESFVKWKATLQVEQMKAETVTSVFSCLSPVTLTWGVLEILVGLIILIKGDGYVRKEIPQHVCLFISVIRKLHGALAISNPNIQNTSVKDQPKDSFSHSPSTLIFSNVSTPTFMNWYLTAMHNTYT